MLRLMFGLTIFELTIFAALVLGPANLLAASDPPVFEQNVRPLLIAKCGKCHDAKSRKGGLDVSEMAALRRGGESGEPAIAEAPDESLLWIYISEGDMPPKGEPALTNAEQRLIYHWLEGGAQAQAEAEVKVTQQDVLPFLYTRCVVCHGRRLQEAGLDLRSVASLRTGGKSGPAIVPGKPGESLLLRRVHAQEMPPPTELIRAGVRPLESSEIALIAKWVEQGALEYDIPPDAPTTEPDPLVTDEDRQFWAFQTPQKPVVPEFDAATLQSASAAGATAIDAFLLRKLRERGLPFSPEADRLTLIRRVAFDLTGLPPDWSDIERFVADSSDDWYPRMVDFYLDSPRYGERWGRYWLDLAGYADSEGKRSADPIREHAWRYRDYVIRSFNSDKPYDQFLIEQLAGDDLFDFERAERVTPEMMDALVATGFLRMAPDGTGSDIVDTVAERFEVVADEIEVIGSALLGLTVKCAQCHTHKYDPIPQRDYYRLVAVFQGAYDLYDWLKPTSVAGQSQQENPTRRYLAHVTDDVRAQWKAAKQPIDDQIAAVRKTLDDELAALRAEFVAGQLESLPEPLRGDVSAALATAPKQRSEVQSSLVAKFEKRLTVSDAELLKQNPELAKRSAATEKQVKELQAKLPPEPLIRALWDRGEPSPVWIFRRGEFTNPGELVGPGVLSVLTDGQTPFEPETHRGGSTGRRLAFAKWLTNPRHPLTARVLVNRIWFHHFGRGIVESLANFGTTGTPPTHPELLDWLATSFVENGYRLKWLHRVLLNSVAYRQSSRYSDAIEQLDADNRWLSRMPLRRLEAEAVRDSLLAVSGQLDAKPFGEPDSVTVRDDGLVTADRGESGWRRTIYVRQRRKELPTILETFDLPQMIPNCTSRPNSTVASQALHLLNNGLVRELSIGFARHIESQVPDDRYQQIEAVYESALSRSPTPEERQLALDTLDRLTSQWEQAAASPATQIDKQSTGGTSDALKPSTRALASFCHVMLNSAGFLFVD